MILKLLQSVNFKKSTVLLVLLSIILFRNDVFAQRSFALRSPTFYVRGDAVIIGNRTMQGSSSSQNDDGTSMSYIDTDVSSLTTLNSSSADLTLPAGSAVVWAGLYWGGRSTHANRNTIKFKHVGDTYITYTATQLDNGNTISDLVGENHYQGFVDVTSLVTTKGGGTYWAGDVYSTTGSDTYTGYYGGWSLIVIYTDNTQPYRHITAYDGYNAVYSSNVTVNISGFLTPASGTFITKMGVIAWEGDVNNTGDRLRLNSNVTANNVFNAANPSNNFFNSTISNSPRSPSTTNNWGVDFDYFTSNISLPLNSTSTNVYFITSGDLYMPGALVFSVEINPALLPVELTFFDAKKVNNDALLQWATASELNNHWFHIERSTDLKTWERIGTVEGNGTTSSAHAYKFTDKDASSLVSTNCCNSVVYYRLIQEDYNGTTSASEIKSVKFKAINLDFSIYPNPASGSSKIYFSTGELENFELRIFAGNGKEIYKKTVEENPDNASLALNHMNSGLYFIEVRKEDKVLRKKLIVE